MKVKPSQYLSRGTACQCGSESTLYGPVLCTFKDLTVTAETGKLPFKAQAMIDSCPSFSTSLHNFYDGGIKGLCVCVGALLCVCVCMCLNTY